MRPFRLLLSLATLAVVLLATGGASAGTPISVSDSATLSAGALRNGWYGDQPLLTVQAPGFKQLFSTQLEGQVFGQPIEANGTLVAATESNEVYGLDPQSGTVRWQRSLGEPWSSDDVFNCPMTGPTVGVTSTPVADAKTNTVYLLAKTYDSAHQPIYQARALDLTTGNERSGFPVTLSGSATNAPGPGFNALMLIQRTALLLLDGRVYAGFAGLCDTPPYYGWVASIGAGGDTKLWMDSDGQFGGGIWQSGAGIASDGPGQLLLATGNGEVPESSPGKSPPAQLSQSVVRLQVQPDGSLQAKDFFAPTDAPSLSSEDQDVGSSGPAVLPAPVFSTPSHPHLLVQGGKASRIYLLDALNLGGYRQGPGGEDAALQVAPTDGGMFGHVAIWPGGGGYVYAPTELGVLDVFHFSVARDGNPKLDLVARVPGLAYLSSPVVTSNGNAPGALVWVMTLARYEGSSGSGDELRAYGASPQNGTLKLVYRAPIGRGTKLSQPTVANGIVYLGNRDGRVLAFSATGPPPAQPLAKKRVRRARA